MMVVGVEKRTEYLESRQFSRVWALCSAIAAIALAFAVACSFPSAAHATFKDVADSFPAAQELGEFGRPITANDLPDGAYKVTARTTSRMCIMYTNPANAEARDSKEQAIVTVSGGNMSAVFYISKAYTHLFWGTQEQAAAKTNKEGTDASAYIPGDPDEGYAPHLFTLPIDALNEPMTIATYSGGDKGIENGMWYTREFVFIMTDAELQAAKAAQEGEQQQGEDPQEEEEQQGDDPQEQQQGEDPQEEEEQQGDDPQEQQQGDDPQEQQQEKESGRVRGSGGGNIGGDDEESDNPVQPVLSESNVVTEGSNEETPQSTQRGQATTQQPPLSGAPKRGVRMNIKNPEVVIDMGGDDVEEDPKEVEIPTLTLGQAIALFVVIALVVGATARSVLFSRSYERSQAPPESPPPREGPQ